MATGRQKKDSRLIYRDKNACVSLKYYLEKGKEMQFSHLHAFFYTSCAQSLTEASRSESWSSLSWKNLVQHVPLCASGGRMSSSLRGILITLLILTLKWECECVWMSGDFVSNVKAYVFQFLSLSPLTSPLTASVPSNRTQTVALPLASSTIFLFCLSFLSCIFVLPLDKLTFSVSLLSFFALSPALRLERRWMSML